MKIASNHLEAFFAVATTLNFSKGATLIFVTQSAVSQRISALEENLGVTLFIRNRSQLKLTPQGEKLLRFCQQHRQYEDELLEDIKTDSHILSGEIRIGGFSSVMRSVLLPALSPLLQNNQKLGLSLVTKELSELMSIAKNGEVDFILTNKNPEREDIEALYLGIEENVLVESIKFKNLKTILDHDPEDVTTSSYFKLLKKKPQNIKTRYVDDVYGLIDGVTHGLGQAILPKHLIRDKKDFVILNPKVILKIPVYLLFYKQPYYSKLHHEIVGHIEQHFKKIFK